MSSQSNMDQSQALGQVQNQSKPPTAQEILQSLELEYHERNRALTATRDSLSKSQEQVIAAQDASHKAFQLLSANKERYLVNIITQHQSQIQTLTQELSKAKQLCTSLIQQVNAAKDSAPLEPQVQVQVQVQVPQVQSRDDNV